jgi:Uma2 family endonuclease
VVAFLPREKERNIMLMTRESDVPGNPLLEAFLSLETPEGYRAELIDGEIVVTPPPNGNHERCITRLVEQVLKNSATPMDFSGNKGLVLPGPDGGPHVIPDLTFVPRTLDLFLDALPWMPSLGVAMVVEVTSSSPDRDRKTKRRAYAAARVPLYLLIDREERQVTLFDDPRRDDYATRFVAAFGSSVRLPPPFSFTLETDGFVA